MEAAGHRSRRRCCRSDFASSLAGVENVSAQVAALVHGGIVRRRLAPIECAFFSTLLAKLGQGRRGGGWAVLDESPSPTSGCRRCAA